jgi:hypothetical protein
MNGAPAAASNMCGAVLPVKPPSRFRVTLVCAAMVGATTCVQANTITYDLNADWSNANNPNSVWAYRQGANLLPHPSDIGTACCVPGSGITGAWAPSGIVGNFLPFWVKATGNNAAGFQTGDIIVHSVDGFNGNPALGETNVTWTAPVAGTIDITGSIWYAHFPLARSNDFRLELGANLLASGTIGALTGHDRANPLNFSSLGLSVSAGDVIEFIVQRSAGQSAGTINGVDLTIIETEATSPNPAPEPASLLQVAAGLWGMRAMRGRSHDALGSDQA